MTNEELCTLIQAGHKEYMTALWEQTQSFGRMLAARFHARLGGYAKLDVEDLLQCRWFAFLQAIDYFSDGKGTFLTCYAFKLTNSFQEAAGVRTSKKEPLNSAISLDVPTTNKDGEESTALIDTIADNTDPIAEAEESVYTNQLHNALESALCSLPERQAQHIRQHFFYGLTLQEIAKQEGVSIGAISAQEVNSFKKIRHSHHAKRLKPFLYESANIDPYKQTGFTSWNRSATTQPERYAENLEKIKK